MNYASLKAAFSALAVAAAIGFAPAAHAESVMKQCGQEYQSAKANNTLNGQTWQEFLGSCRTRLKENAAAPAPTQAAPPVAAAPAAAEPAPGAHESVMKQCGDAWKTAKANNATNGQTWQEFLKSCREQKSASTQPAAAAPAPAPMAPAPTAQPKPAQTAVRPTGAGEFATEAEAKYRCPNSVVWVNTESHIYHYPGTRNYGTTKKGAYMCEGDAQAAGDRASRSKIGQKKAETQ